MKIPKNYHSAHGEEKKGLKDINSFKQNGSVVFKHDLNNGIPDIFSTADCLYSEPAWQSGYGLFKKRANTDCFEYKDYMKSIETTVTNLNKPSYLVGGKHMLKYLNPDHILDIRFNGFYALLLQWNTELIQVRNNIEIINYLSSKYKTVLDFSCGYGQHLFEFDNFIASDLNGKCVCAVAKNMGWKDE